MNVFVLGLPDSGKTTFLAALWESLNHHGSKLTLTHLPEERKYLVEINERWLRCEPTIHTRTSQPQSTTLVLKADDEEVTVQIPDISGEAFSRLWEQREWSSAVHEAAERADAVALFAHAKEIVSGEPIVAVREGRPVQFHDPEDDAPRIPWNPAVAPTQTKLVDLLQQTLEASGRPQIPLTVVLSAWDLLQSQGVAPEIFLSLEMPLLWQFLQTNSVLRPLRVVGVSAQGGEVADEAVAEQLRNVSPPSNRILVQDCETTSHDATDPIAWLIRAAGSR